MASADHRSALSSGRMDLRLTHPWPEATVARAKTTNDLREDDEVGGNQGSRGVDSRLDEIWHQFSRLEVRVGSSSSSGHFEISSGHGGEEEIPHFVPDRLPKVDS